MNGSKENGKKKIYLAVSAVAVLAVVVLAAILAFRGGEGSYRSIRVVELGGNVTVTRSKVGSLDASVNMNLVSGDHVSTSADSYAVLRLDDDKYVMLGENGAIQVEADGNADDGRTAIFLEAGSVLNEIQNPLGQNASYEIVTPSATMSVRGTVFETRANGQDGQGTIEVLVYEGKVAVGLDGREPALYGGGEYTQFTADDEPQFLVEREKITEDKLNEQMIPYLQKIEEGGRSLDLGEADLEELAAEAAVPALGPAENGGTEGSGEPAEENPSEPASEPSSSPEASDTPKPTESAKHKTNVASRHTAAPEAEETPAPAEPSVSATPAPTEAPVTPAPTETPVTPAPTETPVTPAPTEPPAAPAPTETPAAPAPTEPPVQPEPTADPFFSPADVDAWKCPWNAWKPTPEGKWKVIFYLPDIMSTSGDDKEIAHVTSETVRVYELQLLGQGEHAAEPAQPTYTGVHGAPDQFAFVGWYTEDGEKWDFETQTIAAGNVYLFPVWKNQWTEQLYYPVILRAPEAGRYYCGNVREGSHINDIPVISADRQYQGYHQPQRDGFVLKGWGNGSLWGTKTGTVQGVTSLGALWAEKVPGGCQVLFVTGTQEEGYGDLVDMMELPAGELAAEDLSRGNAAPGGQKLTAPAEGMLPDALKGKVVDWKLDDGTSYQLLRKLEAGKIYIFHAVAAGGEQTAERNPNGSGEHGIECGKGH